MGTAACFLSYNKSEFTSAGTNGNALNPAIFAVEVSALTLTTQPSVYKSGQNIKLDFNGLTTAADVALIEAAVAAHVGGLASGGFKRLANAPIQSRTSTSVDDGGGVPPADAIAIQMLSGLLIGGDYTLEGSIEMRTATTIPDHFIEARVEVDDDSVDEGTELPHGYQQIALDSWPFSRWHTFTFKDTFTQKDGEKIDTRVLFRRVAGTGSDPVEVRRAKIFLTHED